MVLSEKGSYFQLLNRVSVLPGNLKSIYMKFTNTK